MGAVGCTPFLYSSLFGGIVSAVGLVVGGVFRAISMSSLDMRRSPLGFPVRSAGNIKPDKQDWGCPCQVFDEIQNKFRIGEIIGRKKNDTEGQQ